MSQPLFQQTSLKEALAALRRDLIHEDGPRISTIRNYRFAIVQYHPADEFKLHGEVQRLSTDLSASGWIVLSLDLQALLLDRARVQSSEWVERVIHMEERNKDRVDRLRAFATALGSTLRGKAFQSRSADGKQLIAVEDIQNAALLLYQGAMFNMRWPCRGPSCNARKSPTPVARLTIPRWQTPPRMSGTLLQPWQAPPRVPGPSFHAAHRSLSASREPLATLATYSRTCTEPIAAVARASARAAREVSPAWNQPSVLSGAPSLSVSPSRAPRASRTDRRARA